MQIVKIIKIDKTHHIFGLVLSLLKVNNDVSEKFIIFN